jgi:pimeloyl-ACP methyl ester carboxylesterase
MAFNLNDCQFFARGSAHTDFEASTYDIPHPLPLPGIVIFVLGVNSDGEWYEACEQGLCDGLNNRLGRRTDQMKYPGPASGQLTPMRYMAELTDDGYINPELDSNTFFNMDNACSPVIRFRWGYKAGGEELQSFGDKIYLNEQNYWGGGPFANGCTSLPDLWNEGLSERLFLWMQVQHLNPVNERHVYACPPRAYYVLAALRLTKLVEAIRKAQADVPITIVCHSQGNMIGMAAAFLGDRLPAVTDANGKSGPCVADNYVLCNPPYSLAPSNFSEAWTQQNLVDPHGRTGRQTYEARIATLAAFFAILRQRKALDAQQTAARIDRRMGNRANGFDAQSDRDQYGVEGSSYGRVTLYCNPHDQVISAVTVQGIGWRGLTKRKTSDEIAATGAEGVFVQRVFAQGFAVGKPGTYHYWRDHWRKPEPGSHDFWLPHSKIARYSIKKGLEASKSFIGCFFTIIMAPVMALVTEIARTRVNALPDADWEIPITAPALHPPFLPQSLRFGQANADFDQGYDPPGASRDKSRVRAAGDAYAGDRTAPAVGNTTSVTDAALGNNKDEASLRYEHHALLRMKAKREGLYKSDAQVIEEDDHSKARAQYMTWRSEHIKVSLAESVDAAATDHSTIFTNPMHAEKALAYDVSVGVCDLQQSDLRKFSIFADWRLLIDLDFGNSASFLDYFQTGKIDKLNINNWIQLEKNECKMPSSIKDVRK